MSQPITDAAGRAMFTCRRCGSALTADDFFELGMRLPDRGESRDDYCDAELLDYIEHGELRAERSHGIAGRLTSPPPDDSVQMPKGE